MLLLLRDGFRILNMDESTINETNFTRMAWTPPNRSGRFPIAPVTHRLSLIAALDNEGMLYYSDSGKHGLECNVSVLDSSYRTTGLEHPQLAR